MDYKEKAIEFFSKYRDHNIYYLIDKDCFVNTECIKDFEKDKKVKFIKKPINQYLFDVEIIEEKEIKKIKK